MALGWGTEDGSWEARFGGVTTCWNDVLCCGQVDMCSSKQTATAWAWA